MKIVIFLRNTEDWANLTIDEILERKKLRGDDSPVPRKGKSWLRRTWPLSCANIELWQEWEKKFNLEYTEYRRRIKEIAMDNWGDKLVYVKDWEKMLQEVEDDDVIIPVDDDDWFHPDIENILVPFFENTDCVIWDQVCNNTLSGRTYSWYKIHKGTGTNNYAMKAKIVKQSPFDVLKRHSSVPKILRTIKCNYLMMNDPFLSCYNYHIGSTNVLLREGIIKPKTRYKILKKDFEWIKPWSDRFDNCLIDLLYKLY